MQRGLERALGLAVVWGLLASACATATTVAPPAPEPAAAPATTPMQGGGGPPPEALLAPTATATPPRSTQRWSFGAAGPAAVTAAAYLVMEDATGAVLLEHNAQEHRSPASTTKIMTALLVLERAALDEVVTVPAAVDTLRASTLMGVKPGERLTVRNLLLGMLLPSGNDAAIALATHVAGDEPAFARLMNQRAQQLGLEDTQFTNSHGLDFRDWGSPYTSAYDLAVISRAAMANPEFRNLVAARSYQAQGEQAAYGALNGNTLLRTYPGADGVKIGWTRRAGHTIVASAVRNGRRLVAVVLGSTARDADAARLLDEGFRMPSH